MVGHKSVQNFFHVSIYYALFDVKYFGPKSVHNFFHVSIPYALFDVKYFWVVAKSRAEIPRDYELCKTMLKSLFNLYKEVLHYF
jgi:hypothetical protein